MIEEYKFIDDSGYLGNVGQYYVLVAVISENERDINIAFS
ncbi:hypothetical protein J5U23_01395 [Saccharolobus shibatae B12]|uniref:Uncharacterized protein n=1 Tax=Saccharolobus shibatae (strain ATCC 51178 / DSM 5389 / JCM 8931 / NBRC 15437 / B12) TaxID=523848 RepID=A0A8F5BNQ8_SACSH|nr:hypothetical protein J5U23_01395 [Saccharolobus shibatae B12]